MLRWRSKSVIFHYWTSIFLFLAVQQFLPLLHAQSDSLKWWNPEQSAFTVIEGQAWPGETESPYDRLPTRAKTQVRGAVWSLSKNNAGIMIRFRSNSDQIMVRYTVNGNHALPHMPATGVSGVDLYAIDSDGQELWCRGQWQFKDTIIYRFAGLVPNGPYHEQGREYRLYLPLYNQVNWLEIGVPEKTLFKPLPVRPEKPIVVYGTSIAQGGCASRPGMAWTSILGRQLDRPLINLAFSGNGRLEKELIELIGEIDAKIFILDCLPNLVSQEQYPDEEVKNRITSSVRHLRENHPETPILLVEHAGYTDGEIMPARKEAYQRLNRIQKETFGELLKEGVQHLYYLSYDEMDLGMDDMVDGTHPNDLGMQHYAEAYARKVRDLLHEPIGKITTTQPCTQYREPGNYDWEERHREILRLNRENPPKTVILANSIVHFWGGLPRTNLVREEASWRDHFSPMGVRNQAYGWDRIENVLWRIYHGELDGFKAQEIVVMIGTNNLHLNSDQEIIDGLHLLIEGIKVRQPEARIVLMGLLPRRNYETRISQLNLDIAGLAGKLQVAFNDIGDIFLGPEGKIEERLFSDGLHPNETGYLKMREKLLPLLK